MDDLSGLDWSAKPQGSQAKLPSMNPSSYPALRPSPSPFGSGRTTPASTQGSNSQFQRPPQSGSPAPDSFSNLVNFGASKPTQSLTLAEKQAQLQAEKRKKEEEKKKLAEKQFGTGNQWESLGTGTSSPAIRQPSPASGFKNDDDDLFAAFNKDTKVDKSSYYPPPPESKSSTPANGTQLDLTNPTSWATSTETQTNTFAAEDDDPFGLSELRPQEGETKLLSKSIPKADADDFDFLGDLAKPVEEVRRQQQPPRSQAEPGKPIEDDDETSSSEDGIPHRESRLPPKTKDTSDPFDQTVAQLVDYGFSPEDARRGIVESGAGTNVQAVANWLLDDAHRKAKAKSQGGRSSSTHSERPTTRRDQTPSGRAEPDLAKSAAAVGNSLFKTANSLWKTGQKKVQQAVSDFQQDGSSNSNQPKWMRDAQAGQQDASAANVTDEALMLESGGRPKAARHDSRQTQQPSRAYSPSQQSASQSTNNSVPRWQQQQKSQTPAVSDSKTRLGRFTSDDDDFSSYVSANRRRKPATPTPTETPPMKEPEPNLLFGSEEVVKPSQPLARSVEREARPVPQKSRQTVQPVPQKREQPSRQIPPMSAIALQSSNKNRLEGTAHFKRGDFATAHASYSSSLSSVPPSHPLTIILLTNRALTALKTGEPKRAVEDADEAIKVIGPGNGQGETVAVTGENGKEEQRDMRELYGKALSRKAEALEQMEKWADAGAVWQICVEAGLGGPTAIKGRQRCQNALAPKPKPVAKAAPVSRPKPSATASLAPQKSSEAVTRLREANKAAAREDDEKFALSEKVDARVAAWRDGKRDNLRALVSSLDKVLWEGSGWKTIGLHELVMANKVKISYMKAIAKTHPDKLPQDANTEVKLIAGLVFSTLNEAWDKFKTENGL